jgi:hypothetical protein
MSTQRQAEIREQILRETAQAISEGLSARAEREQLAAVNAAALAQRERAQRAAAKRTAQRHERERWQRAADTLGDHIGDALGM